MGAKLKLDWSISDTFLFKNMRIVFILFLFEKNHLNDQKKNLVARCFRAKYLYHFCPNFFNFTQKASKQTKLLFFLRHSFKKQNLQTRVMVFMHRNHKIHQGPVFIIFPEEQTVFLLIFFSFLEVDVFFWGNWSQSKSFGLHLFPEKK